MAPPVGLIREGGFLLWRDRVDRLVRLRLGVTLDALPEVAVRAGYEAGDTPAEFVAGAATPLLDEEDAAAWSSTRPSASRDATAR
ncbi:MAG TPA: hypothetical protein VKZ63_17580 [Kofleriaceae bacterium]|nr:hypothetical protein [Kofleriaceae bacterium]